MAWLVTGSAYRNVNKLFADDRHIASVSEALLWGETVNIGMLPVWNGFWEACSGVTSYSYFSRTRLKRNHSSTSDGSDLSISSENDSKKQEKKCMNTVVEDSDMAVQAALDNISKRLDTLATKVDIEQMRDEVKCLTKTFMEKLEKLEGQLFDTEVKADKLESEVKSLKKVNKTATGIIKPQDRRIKQNERELNNLQQYSRKWNLWVFKVQEEETAANCTTKVCAIISDKAGIPITTSDIKVAHRTGQRSSTRARPILCDSLIVRRETASSSVGATSRTKVMPLGKTQCMQIIKCSEKQMNILLQCRCGVQMGKFLPRWRMVTLLEWTFTQIWMKLSGMICQEMKWVQMKNI